MSVWNISVVTSDSTGFYTPMDSLTIIEQPEVHLHPRMQADLGDLFIDIVFLTSRMQNIEVLKSVDRNT